MKYALIGCGRIAVNHMKAAINNKLEIVAVCDDLAAEALGDVLHSNCAFFFQGCHPFFRRSWLQHLVKRRG